jgi:hypothetical protein
VAAAPLSKTLVAAGAFVLIIGGITSSSRLGLWMLPLGMALLSDDFPWLKVWFEKAARGIGFLWQRIRNRPV